MLSLELLSMMNFNLYLLSLMTLSSFFYLFNSLNAPVALGAGDCCGLNIFLCEEPGLVILYIVFCIKI
jgi:hypothetical protein